MLPLPHKTKKKNEMERLILICDRNSIYGTSYVHRYKEVHLSHKKSLS